MEFVMDSYKEIVDSVFYNDTYNWWYYKSLNRGSFNYFSLKESSRELIETIYHAGGKDSFFNELDGDLDEKRCIHMVSAFFLGHYFVRRLSIFSELKQDNSFSWFWYLCCLYHDVYFNNEKSGDHQYNTPYYFGDSRLLLYSKDTIEKYRDLRLMDGCYDHGIYAASALSNHYHILYDKNRNISNKLNIDRDTKNSVNCIAKVIASHNVFIASNKTQEKYQKAGLDSLIPSENSSCKMPKKKGKYELLYLLLCLVDILEPTKRNMNIENIMLEIRNGNTIELTFDSINNADYCNEYFKNIIDSEMWLNYISVNFSKSRNHYIINIELL